MVFNSFEYLIFFTAVVAAYFATPFKWRWIVILCSSYFFYMSWNPVYGFLLLGTTFLDWALARYMVRTENSKAKRKTILITSIVCNLGVLFFFKYFNFASYSLFALLGLSGDSLFLNLLLPIGISFYTFQSIAYMIDVYRGDLPAEKSFFRYATFVSFFPHLVSGPILRPSNILPQVHEKKPWDSENLKIGLYMIATGLVKKIVIADRLGAFVNQVYLQPANYSGATLLVATYFFAFQIYCDFSGYTDIAIGSARILGYTIPDNFRQPYFSQSITEFWRRWHISLSSWLRDYVYIGWLGGNRKGTWKTYRNLFITMLLGGIWHGAAWTFVVWGFLHGLYLAVERVFKIRTTEKDSSHVHVLSKICRVFLTFNLVSLAWIFFRAPSFSDALFIVGKIVTHFGVVYTPFLPLKSIALYAVLICCLLAFDYLQMTRNIMQKIISLPFVWRWSFAYAVLFGLIFFGAEANIQFIYFQF